MPESLVDKIKKSIKEISWHAKALLKYPRTYASMLAIAGMLKATPVIAQDKVVTMTTVDQKNRPLEGITGTYLHQGTNEIVSSISDQNGQITLNIGTLAVADATSTGIKYFITPPAPNPTDYGSNINVSVLHPGTITLYNILGQTIDKKFLGAAGEYNFFWGGKDKEGFDVATGLYFYVVQTKHSKIVKKLTYFNKYNSTSMLSDPNIIQLYGENELIGVSKNTVREDQDLIALSGNNVDSDTLRFQMPHESVDLDTTVLNKHPSLLSMIADTIVQVGDSVVYNMNQKIDNDELLNLTTNDARLQIVQDTLLKYVATYADTIIAQITETDWTNPNINLMMNFGIYTPAPIDTLDTIPTFNIPDTLFAFEDSSGILIPNLNAYRTDEGLQAVMYAISNQSNPELVNLFMANDTALAYQTILENGFGQSQLIASISDGQYTSFDSALVIIQDVFDPTIPNLNLPDTLFAFEDSSGILIPNLNSYRTDGGLQAVMYAISNQTNPSLVNASVLNDTTFRYSTLLANQSGQSIVTVAIDDGSNYSQDNALLLVQPVNDPIRFVGNLANQTTAEDSSLTIDVGSTFENLDNEVLDYVMQRLGQPIDNVTQEDNNGIITITSDADWNGTLDSLVAQAKVRGTEETAESNLLNIYVAPRSDAPTLIINPLVTSVDEAAQGPIVLANFTLNDVDAGDIVISTLDVSSDSVYARIQGNQVILDSLQRDYHGIPTLQLTGTDLEGAIATGQIPLTVNPISDVTFILRTLNQPYVPIMDNVESTFQIGDSIYTSTNGQITVQVLPGLKEVFAFNDSTGIFDDNTGEKLYESHIAIREAGLHPLLTPALATRSWGDQSSAVTFGTNDRVIDLYVFGLGLLDYQKINTIINTGGQPPTGLDKPNTLTPEIRIDSTWVNYIAPDEATVEKMIYVVNTMMTELGEEYGSIPIWGGFGDAEGVSEGNPTTYLLRPDHTAPPGWATYLADDNNRIWGGYFLLHHSASSLQDIAVEIYQMDGATGDVAGLSSLVLRLDNNGNFHYSEFAKTAKRMRTYFETEDNF